MNIVMYGTTVIAMIGANIGLAGFYKEANSKRVKILGYICTLLCIAYVFGMLPYLTGLVEY